MLTSKQLVARTLKRESVHWHSRVNLRTPHDKQRLFLDSPAKRKVIRAGRRGGKTTGIAILAARAFLAGRRILYAAPTEDQVETFWWEIKAAFEAAIDTGALYKNETKHILEVAGTKNRIRAKTAWDADSLRGDYGDLIILDELQLIAEDALERVVYPMLLDNDGDLVLIYTPPSLSSKSRTKARDPQFAAKLFKRAEADDSGRWAAFHFRSYDNPHISENALAELTQDMTQLAIQQEIEALDLDEVPGALWTRSSIEQTRVKQMPALTRLVIGVDPPGGRTECGIIAAGLGADGHGYVLGDVSLHGSPETWAAQVIDTYHAWEADRVVVEINFGGDMVKHTLRTARNGGDVAIKTVHASRGKAIRAEPIAALYERGMVHHVGGFAALEDEQCSWVAGEGMPSPNRLDALVWALTELLLKQRNQKAEMATW